MNLLEDFYETLEKAQLEDPTICFIIYKSNNKNIVAYSSKVENGKFLLANPINKFWQTWEELDNDGKPTIYELSKVEKKFAYDTSYSHISDTRVDFTINAYKKLPISLSVENGEIITRLTFSGMKYHLLGIYVHLDEKATNMTNLKPKGITLVVKLPLSEEGTIPVELSPLFTIYIDAKTSLD